MEQNQFLQANEAQCCVDYCKTSFNAAGNEVVNAYKCGQKSLSSSDIWHIQKNRKDPAIRKEF